MRLEQPSWPKALPTGLVRESGDAGTDRTKAAGPGTWGSLVGLGYAAAVAPMLGWPALVGLSLVVGYFAVGICGEAEVRLGQADPGEVILDEFVAMPLCFLGWSMLVADWPAWVVLAAGFVAFRFFDIRKPLGISRLQRLPAGWVWSRTTSWQGWPRVRRCTARTRCGRWRAEAELAAEPLRQRQQVLDGDFDEETLLQDVDGEDDTVGIGRIVDETFEPVEGSAHDFDAAALGEERHHADLVAGGDDRLYVGELAKKGRFVGDRDGAGEEVLLVDARLQLKGHAREDVAGEERLGEFLGSLRVVADAGDEREVVLEAFGGHERGEFLSQRGLAWQTNHMRAWAAGRGAEAAVTKRSGRIKAS